MYFQIGFFEKRPAVDSGLSYCTVDLNPNVRAEQASNVMLGCGKRRRACFVLKVAVKFRKKL